LTKPSFYNTLSQLQNRLFCTGLAKFLALRATKLRFLAVIVAKFDILQLPQITKGQCMNIATNSDENLLVVVAVEEYARRHHIPATDAFSLFSKYGVIKLLRASYDTLHTQDLYESYYFAEKILERKPA
jgi:hypothetical protein